MGAVFFEVFYEQRHCYYSIPEAFTFSYKNGIYHKKRSIHLLIRFFEPNCGIDLSFWEIRLEDNRSEFNYIYNFCSLHVLYTISDIQGKIIATSRLGDSKELVSTFDQYNYNHISSSW